MKPLFNLTLSASLLWLAAAFSSLLCTLPPANAANASNASPKALPISRVQVLHVYPHDPNAFTQGLFFKDGFLYEGTGLNGRSSIRKVRLETGEVLQKRDLPEEYFGEGITWWGKQLIEITWQSQRGFTYNLETFAPEKSFGYPGEGWGITRNDKEIILSDGTPTLRFLDPQTMREAHRIKVTANGVPVEKINELEWVEGEIYANIWQTDRIARIDPQTGHVLGWIDLKGLLYFSDYVAGHTDVLNGIAYDAEKKRLFVTGKHWPKLFEVKVVK